MLSWLTLFLIPTSNLQLLWLCRRLLKLNLSHCSKTPTWLPSTLSMWQFNPNILLLLVDYGVNGCRGFYFTFFIPTSTMTRFPVSFLFISFILFNANFLFYVEYYSAPPSPPQPQPPISATTCHHIFFFTSFFVFTEQLYTFRLCYYTWPPPACTNATQDSCHVTAVTTTTIHIHHNVLLVCFLFVFYIFFCLTEQLYTLGLHYYTWPPPLAWPKSPNNDEKGLRCITVLSPCYLSFIRLAFA